jgi:hypothetical protein
VKPLGKEVEMKALSAAVVVLAVLAGRCVGAQDGRTASPSLLKATFGKLPIYFIENRGVYPDEVAFYIQGADKTLFFTKEGITFRLKGRDRDWVVKAEFVGANPDVVPCGEDRQQAVFSYFRGPEKDWKTGLKTYSKIVYRDLWPGIDLVYYGTVNKLKYEFAVSPGADPAKIRLRYRGITSLATTEIGALRVETPEGSFEDAPPEAWQEIDGKRVQVTMGYAIREGVEFGFSLGDFDRTHPLVLDPAVLVYCGYIGGQATDLGHDIAVDTAGNVYVTGDTQSQESSFPVEVGPDLTFNMIHTYDAFVAKVNARGNALIYCGYIGGNSNDYGRGIAVDAAGMAYVAGYTTSDEKTFPTKVGPDLTHNGYHDVFVAKVNAQGTALVYCGYIGGNSNDYGRGIAVDMAGMAYVAGHTSSTEQTFPVNVGPDLTYGGSTDAFVAKVNAQGNALVYCGYIGGSRDDFGRGIAVDTAGMAYVAGDTFSDEKTFPTKIGPDLTHNGNNDGFVAKVNAEGNSLVYCGFIGGLMGDVVNGIGVDTAGMAYVAGDTGSDEATFPTKVGPDLTHNGISDAFVAKVNAKGSALAYCGYIGGGHFDWGRGIAVDMAGMAYVVGDTYSDEKTFPAKLGPNRTSNSPGAAFVAKVNTQGTALVYCGFIGGLDSDQGNGIAVDTTGSAYVVGHTASDEGTFPTKVGPDLTYNFSTDAFVAKVALLDNISASGAPRPGGAITLDLVAIEVQSLQYQVGSSFGTGPIAIDTRQIDLGPDALLTVSVSGLWPSIFSGYRGVIDSKGRAQAAIHIPNIPALIGIHLHSAFVTLDPAAPSGIRSISNTETFTITK